MKFKPSDLFTVFVIATVMGFGALFLITHDLRGSIDGFRTFDVRWALPALALASMDWFGSGLRIWLLTLKWSQFHRIWLPKSLIMYLMMKLPSPPLAPLPFRV